MSKFGLAVLALCVFTIAVPAQDKESCAAKADILLSADKPTIYITFERAGTAKPTSVRLAATDAPQEAPDSQNNDNLQVVWLRLHNNTRWAINFPTDSLYVGTKITPTRLCDGRGALGLRSGIEVNARYKMEAVSHEAMHVVNNDLAINSAINILQPPVLNRSDVFSISWLPAGGSVLFSVLREHLTKNFSIYIPYNYEWEFGERTVKTDEPQHRVYFRNPPQPDETFAQSSGKVKIQAEIDGKAIKSEDIQLEIRVKERIIRPQIIEDDFSVDALGWVDENERDIAARIKYKRYDLKLIDLYKDHFQGRWKISITTAPYLDKSDAPNIENVDYAYMIEFMPISGPGVAISNMKYRKLLDVPQTVAVANTYHDKIKAKVVEAVALYPSEAKTAYKNLRALGVKAIPFIVEIIKDNHSVAKPLRIKKTAQTNPFLIDVITSLPDKQADLALTDLLSSKDVIIRGKAASSLGKRKSKTAIPSLIKLLDDSEVYQVYSVFTHQRNNGNSPTSEVNVLIRDVAVGALEQITGKVLAENATKEVRAKAWRSWWKKQPKSNQTVVAKG